MDGSQPMDDVPDQSVTPTGDSRPQQPPVRPIINTAQVQMIRSGPGGPKFVPLRLPIQMVAQQQTQLPGGATQVPSLVTTAAVPRLRVIPAEFGQSGAKATSPGQPILATGQIVPGVQHGKRGIFVANFRPATPTSNESTVATAIPASNIVEKVLTITPQQLQDKPIGQLAIIPAAAAAAAAGGPSVSPTPISAIPIKVPLVTTPTTGAMEIQLKPLTISPGQVPRPDPVSVIRNLPAAAPPIKRSGSVTITTLASTGNGDSSKKLQEQPPSIGISLVEKPDDKVKANILKEPRPDTKTTNSTPANSTSSPENREFAQYGLDAESKMKMLHSAKTKAEEMLQSEKRGETPLLDDSKQDETLKRPLHQIEANSSSDETENDFECPKLKCSKNEFGAVEVVGSVVVKEEPQEDEEHDEESDFLLCKEQGFGSATPKTSPQPAKLGRQGDGFSSIDQPTSKPKDDEILCCEGCGCYGMAMEFHDEKSCSVGCHDRILVKLREKEKRERELVLQKQKRDARRKERHEQDNKPEKTSSESSKSSIKQERTEEDDDGDDEEDIHVPNEEAMLVSRIIKSHCPKLFDKYPWLDPKRGFVWQRYLEHTKTKPAPLKLWKDPFPGVKDSGFAVGMKLEAIDPEHPALICVVSIAERQGYRLRLHFDGYSDSYDFWTDCDSPDIFPPGWCREQGQHLQPPKGFTEDNFHWDKYLQDTKTYGAPKHLFREKRSDDLKGWKLGMKLEAVDKHNTSLVCVATVTNIMDGRLLIHFDGWEIDYDYWATPSSPYIHPRGYCKSNGIALNTPKGYPHDFDWDSFLQETNSKAAPSWAFKPSREVSMFRKGMKIEAVDRRNPMLIRVASVADVIGHQLKIHFDGWPSDYDLWFDDDCSDIHPPFWCARTGHRLMPPLTPEEVKYFEERGGCQTPGCRGIGHVKGSKFVSHHTHAACPYSPQNIHIESHLPDRIQGNERFEKKEENWIRTRIARAGSVDIEDEGLGRGNRKRKRRKFFDEDEAAPKLMRRTSTASSEWSVASAATENAVVREHVFNPVYVPNPGMGSALPIGWHGNVRFLMDRTLNCDDVLQWSVQDVTGFVGSLPGVSQSDAAKMAAEEIDGEALVMLNQNDIVKILGIKLGPAIKIFNAILLVRDKLKNR